MKRVGSGQRIFAFAVAMAMIVPSLGTAWTARTPSFNSHIDPSLSAGEVALVHTTAGLAGALSRKLADLGAVDIQTESAADTVIARLSPQALAAIATDPSVTVATGDAAVYASGGGKNNTGFEQARGGTATARTSGTPGPSEQPVSLLAIRAPLAWTRTTGDHVTVAVMDTGVADHPDLRGKIKARADFVRDGNPKQDAGGHGTFIAGIIAADGEMKGVAPDADIVSLRVLDSTGSGKLSSVVAGFNWLLRHHDRYGISVLNLSFGAAQKSSYNSDLLSALAESAHFAGMAVVAAAGNDGPTAGSVTSPASDPFVTAVGSFADQGTASLGDDTESTFSARGATLDGFAKPDVLAPGEHIRSLRVSGVSYVDGNGDPIGSASDRYIHMTGSSASAAFASGVAALVASTHRGFTATQLKGALVASGRALSGTATKALDAPNALVRTSAANVGLAPSRLLLELLYSSGQLHVRGVTWETAGWGGITWDGISWETVSWETVSWETVSWEISTWEGVAWKKVFAE